MYEGFKCIRSVSAKNEHFIWDSFPLQQIQSSFPLQQIIIIFAGEQKILLND